MSFYAELPLEELTEIVSRNPDEIELRLALVEHHVRHKNFEDALVQACMTEGLATGHPEVEAWKSMCMIYTGELEAGHELLQRIIRNNPCREFQRRLVTQIVPLFTGETGDPTNADWLFGIADNENSELPSGFVERTSSFIDAVNLLNDDAGQGIEALEFHIQRFSSDINARLYLAIACCGAQRLDEAATFYRQVIELDEECSTAWFDLAAIVPDPEQSIELTRRGLEYCPFAKHARYNLGMFLIQMGRYEEARRELSRIPADSSIYPEVLVAIGMSFEEASDIPNAVECLEKAVILNPDRGDIRGKYGQLLCDCGLFEEAIRQLEVAIELDPDQYCVWANKGLLHLQAGEHEEALQAMQKSLDLNPKSDDAAINLALLLTETGNVDEGIAVLELARKFHPENLLIYQHLGAFYCNKQDLDQALFCIERSIELGADSPTIYWNMANIHCFKNCREQCLDNLAKAIERDPSYAAQFLVDPDFQKYWNDADFLSLMQIRDDN